MWNLLNRMVPTGRVGLFIFALSISASSLYGQTCSYNFPNNLNSNLFFRNIINCSNGAVSLTNVNSHPSGNGTLTFDQNVTLSSLSIAFANGNQPAKFIIPAGITVTINGNLTFSGQPDKDKFLEVRGTLIVNGTLDFGNLTMEIDGNGGSIIADAITNAGNVSCGDDNDCPYISAGSCSGGGNFCNNDVTLPVVMKHFKVKPLAKEAQLEWVTILEENFSHFEIQRSLNGRLYQSIGQLEGKGNGLSVETSYHFTDQKPMAGHNYYRLIAIDVDGSSEIFGPISILFNKSASQAIYIYPNPGNGKSFSLKHAFDPQLPVQVAIFSPSGQLISEHLLDNAQSSVRLHDQLPRGIYSLKIVSPEGASHVKWIVQ